MKNNGSSLILRWRISSESNFGNKPPPFLSCPNTLRSHLLPALQHLFNTSSTPEVVPISWLDPDWLVRYCQLLPKEVAPPILTWLQQKTGADSGFDFFFFNSEKYKGQKTNTDHNPTTYTNPVHKHGLEMRTVKKGTEKYNKSLLRPLPADCLLRPLQATALNLSKGMSVSSSYQLHADAWIDVFLTMYTQVIFYKLHILHFHLMIHCGDGSLSAHTVFPWPLSICIIFQTPEIGI